MFKSWQGRRQPFLSIDILLSLSTIFMIIYSMSNPASDIDIMVIYFSIGLVLLNNAIEMFVTGRRKYFVLTLLTSVFLISTSLWN